MHLVVFDNEIARFFLDELVHCPECHDVLFLGRCDNFVGCWIISVAILKPEIASIYLFSHLYG